MKNPSLLLVVGLAAILGAAAVPKANAGVVVGVGVGAPVYAPPAYGYLAPAYVGRAYVAPEYVTPGPYIAVAPRLYYRHVYARPVFRERWEGRRFVARRDYRWPR